MRSKGDFVPIVVAYLLCVAAGLLVLAVAALPPVWDVLVADMAATVVIFVFSRAYRNSSFYDAYWSVIPPLLALYWMLTHAATSDPRSLLVITLVGLWAIRLTTNWATYWGGLSHEDWRYPVVRARMPRSPATIDFIAIHLIPTFQVFAGCLPIYAVMSRAGAPLGWLDLLAFIVTAGALSIETIADLQLHAFSAKKRPGEFIQSGLWAWSRHPNYFGELSFWWGLMLFGLAAAPQQWPWIVPGALLMTAMFVFASIPLMDKRSLDRRPAYGEYMRRTSALIPFPPRNTRATAETERNT